MRWFKHQKGDTIAEVLISVAVLSLILSISYGLANRSTLAVRQSQERSEAQQINNGQLEQLRSYLADSSHQAPEKDKYFCLSGNAVKPISDINAVPNECTSGSQDSPGVGRYKTYIKFVASDGAYTATTVWDNVTGTGQDKATTAYKVYLASGASVSFNLSPTGSVANCASGKALNGAGVCQQIDYCANIDDNQLSIPPGYTHSGDMFSGTCLREDFYAFFYGRDFSGCTQAPAFSDGYDGCKYRNNTPSKQWYKSRSSASVYAYRNVGITYGFSSAAVKNKVFTPGKANIEIRYRQAYAEQGGVSNFNYAVRAQAGSSPVDFTLPSSSTLFKGQVDLGNNPSDITLNWINDGPGPFGDPNLQIDSIVICRETSNASDGCSSQQPSQKILSSLGSGWNSATACSNSEYQYNGGGVANCYTVTVPDSRYAPFSPVWSYTAQDLIYSASGIPAGDHEVEVIYRNHGFGEGWNVLPDNYNFFRVNMCFHTLGSAWCGNNPNISLDPKDPSKKQTFRQTINKLPGNDYFRISWPWDDSRFNTPGYDYWINGYNADIEIDSVRVLN